MSSSKFGDMYIGRYNVLPKESEAVPYNAPEYVLLQQWPSLISFGDGLDPNNKPKKNKNPGEIEVTIETFKAAMGDNWLGMGGVVDPAWDYNGTADEIQNIYPIQDALNEVLEKSGDGRAIWPSQLSNVIVHPSWDAKPPGVNLPEYDALGRRGRILNVLPKPSSRNHVPVAIVGKLCGVAPLVCATQPIQGKVEQTFTHKFSLSVTDSTSNGNEYGVSVEAGIKAKVVSVGVTGSAKWTNNSSNSLTKSNGSGQDDKFEIPEGTFGRIDQRVAAGLYAGWLFYKTVKLANNSAFEIVDVFGAYPIRIPVQVPDFASPVVTHKMSAPISTFRPNLAQATAKYLQVERQLATSGWSADSDDTTASSPIELSPEHVELLQQRDALAAFINAEQYEDDVPAGDIPAQDTARSRNPASTPVS
jgi:hypothetical protein